jgi:hypothetical protein
MSKIYREGQVKLGAVALAMMFAAQMREILAPLQPRASGARRPQHAITPEA